MRMDQAAIFLPMCALVALTFAVLLLVPVARFRAAAQGKGTVSLPNRDLMNLLELPLLFYVVCIALYITLSVDTLAVALAWLYFVLRLVHSLVHLTYNNVFHPRAPWCWARFGCALAWPCCSVKVD